MFSAAISIFNTNPIDDKKNGCLAPSLKTVKLKKKRAADAMSQISDATAAETERLWLQSTYASAAHDFFHQIGTSLV